jgi:hypothetical protein
MAQNNRTSELDSRKQEWLSAGAHARFFAGVSFHLFLILEGTQNCAVLCANQ